MKRSVSALSVLALLFTMTFTGCGSEETKSVTEGTQQSEIEAYKAKEAELNAQSEKEME